MRAALLCLALWAAACADDPAPAADAGTAADAAQPTSDAGLDPDAGALPDAGTSTTTGPADACNPVTQDCASTDDKCVIEPRMAGDGTSCVMRGAMDRALNAVCGGGDCAPGLVCVQTSSAARCLLACDRASGAPCSTLGADADCRLSVRGTNWGACERLPPICDALTLAPCPADQACQPTLRDNGSFELRCHAPGSGASGERCETTGCARGLICVREEGLSFCRKPCGVDGDCVAPQTCSRVVVGVKYCL